MKNLSKKVKKQMDIEYIHAFMEDMSFDQIEALTNAASEIFSDEKYINEKTKLRSNQKNEKSF